MDYTNDAYTKYSTALQSLRTIKDDDTNLNNKITIIKNYLLAKIEYDVSILPSMSGFTSTESSPHPTPKKEKLMEEKIQKGNHKEKNPKEIKLFPANYLKTYDF
jgi:hypothetical protein